MTKHEFIARLREFAVNDGATIPDEYGHPNYAPALGETILAAMFASWLEESVIPNDDTHTVWERDLPIYAVEAYADFRTSSRWQASRDRYFDETGYEIPDLVDAFSGGLHRVLVAYHVCRLMPLLARAPWLRPMLETTLNAQSAVIDHAWRRFVRVAYRNVMPRIKTERHRANSGMFGTTKLMTFDCAGRVLFTFQRGDAQMTYVADANDMYGNRSGPNSPGGPYAECVSMIEDVVAHWDIDKLLPSETVRIQ